MMLGLALSPCSSRGPSFSPTKLAGIAHWYRADLGITLATGVSQWSDQIGTAHLVQATGANQPSYNVTDAAYNSRPTVQSTAVTKYLAALTFASTQPYTIWLVGEFSTVGGSIAVLGSAGSAPVVFSQGGSVALSAGATLSSAVASNAKHATLCVVNGASSFIGVDNWLAGGVSGAGGANNGVDIALFAYSNGSFGSVGKIAEFVIQSGTPTAAEKTAMAAYFSARYGITIT